MTDVPNNAVPTAAKQLGAAGLIPFVGLAIAGYFVDPYGKLDVTFALAAYSAVILSFLGGVQWGFASARVGTPDDMPVSVKRLALSVVPSLIGWGALFLDDPFRLMSLTIGFLVMIWIDMGAAARGETPAWYLKLRMPLSAIVILCLVIASYA